jgi:hypothetical protein
LRRFNAMGRPIRPRPINPITGFVTSCPLGLLQDDELQDCNASIFRKLAIIYALARFLGSRS